MSKMVFLMSLADKYVAQIKEIAPNWEVIHGKEPEAWLAHLKEAQIVVSWNKHAARECFQPESSVRWVHAWGAGVNGMPIAEFKERGITLTNSSGVHSIPISETIMAMMLAFTRRIHKYVRNQLQKEWHHAYNHMELHGKTIGILGVGAIGEETARLCQAFGMKVLGLRRSGEPSQYVDHMYDVQGLHTLLRESDYVINTLPLTKETYHILSSEQFQIMRETAYLINIGRGATVDTEALLQALNDKKIAGAGLDVFEQEPLPEDHPFWGMENVILTPHSSGSTEHYNDRVFDIFLPNLQQFINGQAPSLNQVDLDLTY